MVVSPLQPPHLGGKDTTIPIISLIPLALLAMGFFLALFDPEGGSLVTMGSSLILLLATSWLLGFRHGIDWDHIAADAIFASLGFRYARHRAIFSISLGAITGTFSSIVGMLFLMGHSALLPAILGG